MPDPSALAAWRELHLTSNDIQSAPYVQDAAARDLGRWFDSLLDPSWERAPTNWRTLGASTNARLLGMRAWWPFQRPDPPARPDDVQGEGVHLQLLVGRRFWEVDRFEASEHERAGSVAPAPRMYLLAGDPAAVTGMDGKDDRAVWVFLAWRLPAVKRRAPVAALVQAESDIAACFPGATVVRTNGDCSHAMQSVLLIAPRTFELSEDAADLPAFVEELERAVRGLQRVFVDLWADRGRQQALVAAARRASRPAAAESPAPVASPEPPQEEDLGGTAASLLQLLQRGSAPGGWPKNIVLYGPPGTGKTYVALRVIRALLGKEPGERLCVVVFHPAYEYSDFLGGIRPETTPSGHLSYQTAPGVFTRLAERAAARPDELHFLLIDELNRGNLPKLLGELLYALEYRDEEVDVSFRREKLVVPSNLLVVATMNTSDRSIGSLDAAVRRRFAFLACDPDPERVPDPERRAVLVRINEALLRHPELDGQRIGHSYLLDGDSSVAEDRWRLQVVPLLEDYARFAGRPVTDLLPAEYLPQAWRDLRQLLDLERRRAAGDGGP